MIDEETLVSVITKQRCVESARSEGLLRSLNVNEKTLESHALVITGVRRCGKSTAMTQRIRKIPDDWFYLKFDSPQLIDLELRDMATLDRIIGRNGARRLYFDEMHFTELDASATRESYASLPALT